MVTYVRSQLCRKDEGYLIVSDLPEHSDSTNTFQQCMWTVECTRWVLSNLNVLMLNPRIYASYRTWGMLELENDLQVLEF